MITKIGVIYQDLNSRGFLRGLRDRLKCDAELIGPPTPIGKTQRLPKKEARLAWQYFQNKGVDLVVRFTDADGDRPQDVHRKELDVVPDRARSMWLCGVAVNNPEEWMCGDVPYLAKVLGVSPQELKNPVQRTGTIKRALARVGRRPDEGQSDVVARIVREAPTDVFRRWLKDDALRAFYTDCRAAAAKAKCDTPNELDAASDA